MELLEAKGLLNKIARTYPDELSDIFKEHGFEGAKVSPENMIEVYDLAGYPYSTQLYDLYSSDEFGGKYDGTIDDMDLNLVGFNGDDELVEDETQKASKFGNFLSKASGLFKTARILGGSLKKTPKTDAQVEKEIQDEKDAKEPIYKSPIFIGAVIFIVVLVGFLVVKKIKK